MRTSSVRFVAPIAALSIATISLGSCSKDKVKESTADTAASAAGSPAASASPAEVSAGSNSADEQTASTPTAPPITVDLSKVVSTPNLFYTAVGAGSFLTLAKLLIAADLLETVKDGGPFTVFAPTDDAFGAVPADTLQAVAADKDKLKKVLLYHVVPGRLTVADLQVGDLMTAEGTPLKITKVGETVLVNDKPIAASDIATSNGVIQVMGSVLLPPDL